MFKNYFKIAIRNLFKNKAFSFINIFGLSIGLASFILISIYIKNELGYDKFQKHYDQIYRPVEVQQAPGLGSQDVAVTMGPLAPALKSDFPEILEATRILPMGEFYCRVGDKGFYEPNILFADSSVFNVFTIPFIEGDPKTALSEPFSIVISKDVEHKYFGNEDPLGKIISLHNWLGANDYKVTGVIKNYPKNSHLYFDMLASYSTAKSMIPNLSNWGDNFMATYILLQKGYPKENLEKKFPAFIKRHLPKDSWNDLKLYLQPLKDIHLYSSHIKFQTFNRNQGDINSIYTFSIIAVFILLIACINFMNLSTARSAKRVKEAGIRKVLGSNRKNLIYQFIGEAVIISLLALIIAVIIVELVFPYFQTIFPDKFTVSSTNNIGFLLQLLGIAIVLGILAGSYPAFFLSSFTPSESLKSSFASTSKGAFLRKSLVVFQFAIAVILIVCTGVVMDQMSYIQNKNLGFNKEHVLYMPIRDKDTRNKIGLLKNELLKNPDILSASAAAGLIGASGSQGTETIAGTNGKEQLMMRRSFVDFDFIKTMQMKILKGRNFSRDYPTDSNKAVIINEATVKNLGWKDPIGKIFEGKPDRTVIGVVKDFNFYSLHTKIEPMIMAIVPSQFHYLLVRIRPDNIKKTVDYLKDTWNNIVPNRPFEYSFLDQQLDRMYKNDENTGRLFALFSLITIIIACLGLFGLASFVTEQRTKEIGIRKVLGAKISGIIALLTKEFIKWILIASVIAFPLAYIISQNWLDNFAYRTQINFVIFIAAALIVILIAAATISYQAVKAALTNPVKSLRYE